MNFTNFITIGMISIKSEIFLLGFSKQLFGENFLLFLDVPKFTNWGFSFKKILLCMHYEKGWAFSANKRSRLTEMMPFKR